METGSFVSYDSWLILFQTIIFRFYVHLEILEGVTPNIIWGNVGNQKFYFYQCQSSVPNGSWLNRPHHHRNRNPLTRPFHPRLRPWFWRPSRSAPNESNDKSEGVTSPQRYLRRSGWKSPWKSASHGPMAVAKKVSHQDSPTTRTPWVLAQCHIDNFPLSKIAPKKLIEFIDMFPKSCRPAMTKRWLDDIEKPSGPELP